MRGKSKKSLVTGVLALSMILMGTGYAYWTDDLNVTTKATTGNMDVTFADLGLYAQYTNEASGWSIVDGIVREGHDGYVDSQYFLRGSTDYNAIAAKDTITGYYNQAKGYNNVEFNAELVGADNIKKDVGDYTTANAKGSDQIVLSVNKMYPGYAQTFRTDILNVGEIAAKLSSINFEVIEKNGTQKVAEDPAHLNYIKDMLGVAIYIDKEAFEFDPADNGKEVFKLCATLGNDNTFTVGGVTFLRLSALENPEIQAAIQEANLLCSPDSDNRMDMYVAIAMDPDADGAYTSGMTTNTNYTPNDAKDAASQNMAVDITMDFLWDQFNVGKDAGQANILVNQNAAE